MAQEKTHRMKQSDTFRDNADNCRHLAERANSEPLAKRYQRMAEAWMTLAEEQDWLDGEKAPALRCANRMGATG